MRKINLLFLLIVLCIQNISAQYRTSIAKGWANNSVNTVVFRKNSVVTHKKIQFAAFYDEEGCLVLAKRKLKKEQWEVHKTQYKANVRDAHNSISIMIDGDGYLHVAWDHHDSPLSYAVGVVPYSLQLGNKRAMTSKFETNITYPEFYKLPNGDLLFMYRDGQSGSGNLVLNRYSLKNKQWSQVQTNLIDGENERSAYWQSYVDYKGVIHLSWVWRETWDVSTNHDMCYAKSEDGGVTWYKSTGEQYNLPITAETAEYCLLIPQESELINQTSITTDNKGNPYIATYFREKESDIPQYHVIYNNNGKWKSVNLGFRKTPFSLKGGGTKQIPISRPQLLAKGKDENIQLMLIFRDEERDSRVSIAISENYRLNKWKIQDLTDFSVGSWEPSYDTELWKDKKWINLFVQETVQLDEEGMADVPPTNIYILTVDQQKQK